MAFLSIATVVCPDLLAGGEFRVSAFVNPVLRKPEATLQARLAGSFA